MANRFIRPQKADTPYWRVDRFVQQPFEEAQAALAQRQQNYNIGLDIQNKAADAAQNIPTRSIDTATKNKLINDMNARITDTVKQKYGGDYGAAHNDIMNIIREYSANPFWERATTAFNQQQAHQKLVNEARQKGQQVLDFDTSIYETPVVDEQGNFNTITAPESQIKTDWNKAYKEATALHANTFQSALRKAGGDATGYLQSTKTKGISDADVRRSLNDSYIRFMNSDAGMQQYRYLTDAMGLAPEQAQQEIKDNLLSFGMQQKFTEQDTGYQRDLVFAAEQEQAKAAAKAKAEEAKAARAMPTFVPNYTNKGYTAGTSGGWFRLEGDVSMPIAGESSRVINQNVTDYKPLGRTFVFGKDKDASEPEATSDALTGRMRKGVVGWKITGGDVKPELLGTPLNKGPKGALDESAPDNNVNYDSQRDEYYVINGDKKVIVQPQGYMTYDLKNGDTAFEEMNKTQSMQEFGGRDVSGQSFLEVKQSKNPATGYNQTDFTIRANSQEIMEALGNLPPAASDAIMGNLQQLSRKSSEGIQLTREEVAYIKEAEALINQGYYENVVQPRYIGAKNEYTPKGIYGETSQDTVPTTEE